MASPYKDDLDSIIWSFSTLHLYEQCPYAFYKYKIEGDEGEENFFAENGSAMHTTFQKLETKQISLEQAPGAYLEEYNRISSTTSKNVMSNTFDTCLDYLCCCTDDQIQKYDIIWVEEREQFKIGKYQFTGFVDLLLRDKQTKGLILVDHKSNPPFFKKKGGLLKSQEENFSAYSHQMYLYCKGIYEKFSAFPEKIIWHHFKNMGELSVIDFNEEDYESTLKWAKNLIARIYRDKQFREKKNYIFCKELCGYRNTCEYRYRRY